MKFEALNSWISLITGFGFHPRENYLALLIAYVHMIQITHNCHALHN